jgi:hypothetical protein
MVLGVNCGKLSAMVLLLPIVFEELENTMVLEKKILETLGDTLTYFSIDNCQVPVAFLC